MVASCLACDATVSVWAFRCPGCGRVPEPGDDTGERPRAAEEMPAPWPEVDLEGDRPAHFGTERRPVAMPHPRRWLVGAATVAVVYAVVVTGNANFPGGGAA